MSMLSAEKISKPDSSSPSRLGGITLLVLVNLIAAAFLYSPGTDDIGTLQHWTGEVSSYGLTGGFAHSGTDYPPLAFVMLAAIARCAHGLGAGEFIGLKVALLLFLAANSACFYWFTRNLMLTAAFEFALILNSMALGYLDIFFAPFLVAGLFQLQRGNLHSGLLLFAIACFIKWQPMIIAPFVCAYVLVAAKNTAPDRGKLRQVISPFAVSAVVVAIPIASIFGGALLQSLQRAMTHVFLSGNALNLAWLHTWTLHLFHPDKYGALRDGLVVAIMTAEPLVKLPEKILFYSSYSIIFLAFALQEKTFLRLIAYSTLGYLAYFLFNAGVHENHLFLVCCLAWILAFVDSANLLRCINLSIAANANLLLFYGVIGQPLPFRRVVVGIDITLLFALANLCLFAELLFHIFKADGVAVTFWSMIRRLRIS